MPLGTHRATDTLDNYALPFPLLHNQPTFKVCILMIKISDFAFNFFLSKSNQIHLPWNYSQDKKKYPTESHRRRPPTGLRNIFQQVSKVYEQEKENLT
jgi:hypothetical protein